MAVSAGAKNWPTVENRKLITNSRPSGRPGSSAEQRVRQRRSPPRIRLVAISTTRLSQRSTYTPASTPKMTDGMISVSTARLSWRARVAALLDQDDDAVPDRVLRGLADRLGQPQQQEVAVAPDRLARPRLGRARRTSSRHRARTAARARSVRLAAIARMPGPRRRIERHRPRQKTSSGAARTGCAAAGCGAGRSRSADRCRRPGARRTSRSRRTRAVLRRRTTSPTWTSTNFAVLMRFVCSRLDGRRSARRGCSRRARGVDRRPQTLGLGARGGLPVGAATGVQHVRLALTSAPPPSASTPPAPSAPGRPPGRRRRAAGSARAARSARTAATSAGYVAPTTRPSVPCLSQVIARRATCTNSGSAPSTSRSWISPRAGIAGLAQHEHAAVGVVEERLERVAAHDTD